MEQAPWIEQPPVLKRSWFRRHRLITAVFCIVGFFTLFYFSLDTALNNSDAKKLMISEAEANPLVIEKLGAPITAGKVQAGSIELNGSAGEAELTIPLTGPKGMGTIHSEAVRRDEKWKLLQLQFTVDEKLYVLLETPNPFEKIGVNH